MAFFRPESNEQPDDIDVQGWLRVMFGAGSALGPDGVSLVVRVGGRPIPMHGPRQGSVSQATMEAIRELTQSLSQHSGLEVPGDAIVTRPTVAKVRVALEVLQDTTARRNALTAAVQAVARRVLRPLEPLLAPATVPTRDRLAAWRERILLSTGDLNITAATLQQIRETILTGFADADLDELATAEDERFRPRVIALAQKIVDALAGTYSRAIERFDSNAGAIADRIVRRLPEQLALRDLPDRLKLGFVSAMTAYLETETAVEITGTLATLSREYADVLHRPGLLVFPPDAHRDVATACWTVVSSSC